LKGDADPSVSPSIAFNLGNPVLGVSASIELSFESLPVTAVPKIAVAENDNSCRQKNKIRFASKTLDISIEAKACLSERCGQ